MLVFQDNPHPSPKVFHSMDAVSPSEILYNYIMYVFLIV